MLPYKYSVPGWQFYLDDIWFRWLYFTVPRSMVFNHKMSSPFLIRQLTIHQYTSFFFSLKSQTYKCIKQFYSPDDNIVCFGFETILKSSCIHYSIHTSILRYCEQFIWRNLFFFWPCNFKSKCYNWSKHSTFSI